MDAFRVSSINTGILIFKYMTPCDLVVAYHLFGRTCCLYLQGINGVVLIIYWTWLVLRRVAAWKDHVLVA
jgi:hypothetical protein